MLPEYFEFSLPTKLVYGVGILGNIGDAVSRFGKRRAMLVTDEVLARVGPVDKVKAGFAGTDVEIVYTFDKVQPNSDLTTVTECAKAARRRKIDLIIAVGGGSVIDTAKVANLLIVKKGKIHDHMGAYLLDPGEELLPFIVVPTTAGTGSEVTKVAVIADVANDVKLPFQEEQFLPQLSILDPEVTVSMPGKLTAATGMDAMTHAVEAYVDKEHSPASDALALHAIELLSTNILRACAHPDDLEARGGMLVGSFLAGVAFSHSMVGMCHGIAHALGGVYHVPHGLANALVLPEVMEFNLDAALDRYVDIAAALGVEFPQPGVHLRNFAEHPPGRGPLERGRWLGPLAYRTRTAAGKALGRWGGLDRWFRRRAAAAGIERLRTLNRQLAHITGMALNLRDAGVDDGLAKLDQLATTAMQDGTMLYNPREPERSAVEAIVRKLHDESPEPLPVPEEALRAGGAARAEEESKDVFESTQQLYAVLISFFELLRDHPDVGVKLAASNLCVQFVYREPDARITVDATSDEVQIVAGDFDGKPEVTMSMRADFAHRFWHGKANLVTAITRRQVVARGNVPKTLKLLPILKPAYTLYPKHLEGHGLGHKVMG
jgi:alcohol dehydrogenase class IV